MTNPYLSVVLITKNEEKLLPELLASLPALEPIEYEVCIYDTGSTDATVEIARQAGARVIEGEWAGDYAAARNHALNMARGVWALSLDADETIEVDAVAFREFLQTSAQRKPTVFVHRVHACGQTYDTGAMAQWTFLRLLRVGESYWFRPIHEFPAARREGYVVEGEVVPREALSIVNLGLEDEQRESASVERKTEVTLALAEREEREGAPPDMRALTYFDLARSMRGENADARAEKAYQTGLAIRGAHEIRPVLLQYYVDFLLDRSRWDDAAPLIEELADLAAEDLSLVSYTTWQRARLDLGQGRPGPAADALLTLGKAADKQGLFVPPERVARHALQATADAGRLEEALLLAVQLVARCGAEDIVPGMLTLWGARKPELLAKLLLKAAPPGTDPTEIADVLKKTESATKLVDALISRTPLPMK